jgi:hypothetical protein
MSKLFKVLLVSSVAILITSEITYPYTCQPSDRQAEMCSTQYVGVCGLFKSTIQCIQAPCGQTFDNVCNACKQDNIATVALNTCDKQSTSSSVNNSPSTPAPSTNTTGITTCTAESRKQICTMEYRGICATYDNTVTCDQKPCVKTMGTSCQACGDTKVATVVDGACAKDSTNISTGSVTSTPTTSDTTNANQTTCTSQMRNAVCPADYKGVCAFYGDKIKCDQKPCMKTYATVCTACSDPSVNSVSDGICVKDSTGVVLSSSTNYIYSSVVILMISFFLY